MKTTSEKLREASQALDDARGEVQTGDPAVVSLIAAVDLVIDVLTKLNKDLTE